MSAAQDKASIKSFMSSLFSAYHGTASAQNAIIYATKNEVAQSLAGVTYQNATTTQDGLMSAVDKASLDAIPTIYATKNEIAQSLGGGTSRAVSADSLSNHLNYSTISAKNSNVLLNGSTIKGPYTVSDSPTITGNPRFTGNVYFYATENSSVDAAKVYFGNATVNGTNTTFTGSSTITGNPRFTGKVYYNNHVYLYTSATDDDGDNPTVNGAIVHMSNSSVAASGATIKGNPKFTGNPQFLGDPRFNNDVYFYTVGDNEVYTGAELHMEYATISGSPTINGSNFYMKNATLSGNGISVTSAVKFNDSVVCAQRVTLNSGLDLAGSIVNSNLTLTAGTSPNSADICHINYPNIAFDNGPIIYMPNSSVRAAGSTVVGNPLFSEGLRLGTVSSANNGSIWYSTSTHKLMLVTGNSTYTFSPDA